MKKFIHFLLVLPLILNSACSDDSNNVSLSKGKRITKIVEESQNYIIESLFTYDDKGRVVEVFNNVKSATESGTFKLTYQYDETSIIKNTIFSGEMYKNVYFSIITHIYSLEGGKITKGTQTYSDNSNSSTISSTISYLYDNTDYLQSYSSLYLTWDNANLEKIDQKSSTALSYSYSNIPWIKGMILNVDNNNVIPNTDPILWAYGYYGNIPKNLPNKYEECYHSSMVYNCYSFEFVISDGLITKVVKETFDKINNETDKSIMNYTWESI